METNSTIALDCRPVYILNMVVVVGPHMDYDDMGNYMVTQNVDLVVNRHLLVVH